MFFSPRNAKDANAKERGLVRNGVLLLVLCIEAVCLIYMLVLLDFNRVCILHLLCFICVIASNRSH